MTCGVFNFDGLVKILHCKKNGFALVAKIMICSDKEYLVIMKFPSFATVITLKDRRERLKSFLSWYKDPLYVLTSERSVRGGTFGCFESHLNAIKFAHEKSPNEPSLHFEDDALPTQWNNIKLRNEVLQEVVSLMQEDWSIIGLGGCPLAFSSGKLYSRWKYIARVKFAEAHAYILSPSFRHHLLQISSFSGHFDYRMMMETSIHSYLVVPELFGQDDRLGSDNSTLLKYILPARSYFKSFHYAALQFCGETPWRYHEMAFIALLFLLSNTLKSKELFYFACFMCLFHIANCRILDPAIHTTNPIIFNAKNLTLSLSSELDSELDSEPTSSVLSVKDPSQSNETKHN